MHARPAISRSLRLRTTAQEYVLEDVDDQTAHGPALRLQRSQTDGCIVTQLPPMSGYGELGESMQIVGVMGVVQLLSGPYIIVIVSAELVGKIVGHDVMRVAQVEMFPFAADTTSKLSADQAADEHVYLKMLRSFVATKHMYFSHTFDLTTSLQAQSAWSPEQLRQPIWRTADSRFFWNEAMARPLIQESADAFILPLVLGNVAVERCQVRVQREALATPSRAHCTILVTSHVGWTCPCCFFLFVCCLAGGMKIGGGGREQNGGASIGAGVWDGRGVF
eukprot:COSAG05_NODE_323_length_11408_cov_361.826156_11_plen_278_part_00